MKLILALATITLLTACGGDDQIPPTNNSSTTLQTTGAVVVNLATLSEANSKDAPTLAIAREDTQESVILFADLIGIIPSTPTIISYYSKQAKQEEVVLIDDNGLPAQFIVSTQASGTSGTLATATFDYTSNYNNATLTFIIAGTTTRIVKNVPISATDTQRLRQLFTELTAQQLSGAFSDVTANEWLKIALNTGGCTAALAASFTPAAPVAVLAAGISCASLVAEVSAAGNDNETLKSISDTFNIASCITALSGCLPALIDYVEETGGNQRVTQPRSLTSKSGYRVTSYISEDDCINNIKYDNIGRVIEKVAESCNGVRIEIHYTYNGSHQLLSTLDIYNEYQTLSLYSYNSNGRIISIETYGSRTDTSNGIQTNFENSNNTVHNFIYQNNRLIRDEDSNIITTYQYDGRGNISRGNDSDGDYVIFNYNSSDVLQNIKYPRSYYVQTDGITKYDYDTIHTVIFTYDELGRLDGLIDSGDNHNTLSSFIYESGPCVVPSDLISSIDAQIFCGEGIKLQN